MPPVAIAVADVVATALFTVGLPAAVAEAAGGFILALGGAAGLGAAIGAWATVAGLAGLFAHPSIGEAGTAHSPIDFKADPQAAVPFMVGRTANAGNIVLIANSGPSNTPPNNYLHFVTVYGAGGPYEAFESIKINDNLVAFDGTGACTTSPYGGWLWWTDQLGHPGDGAMAQPSGTTSDGALSAWDSTHLLTGMAASWMIAKTSNDGTDPYQGSEPTPLPVWKGAKMYDPRLDSTQTGIGGAGSHRLNDPTSWAFSQNPWISAYNWCLGRFANGVRILGVGAPPSAIDVAAFAEAANIADANGWILGGVIYSTDSKWEALCAMCQAGGGIPLPLGGQISCQINTPRVSLATLTGDALTDMGTVCLTQSRKDRINQIIPTYRSEDHDWQQVEADPIVVPAYLAADGELRSKAVVYPLVQNFAGDNPNQVAQLARYDIENAREGAPITLPCRVSWLGYRPGDCLTIDDPSLGLVAQKVLLMTRQPDPQTGQLTFVFRTETDAKHPAALAQTGVAPPIPPTDTGT